MLLAWLKCTTPPSPCSQGSREYRCFVAAILDNHCRNSSWSLYFLCALSLVNSQWVCQEICTFVKTFYWKFFKKRESPWWCYDNTKNYVSTLKFPNITLVGDIFDMEKGFLNGFENYVAFPLLEIPLGQCYSIPSTFHHSSLSLFVLHFMFFFPFDFLFHLNVFQLQQYIKKENFLQIIASQMFLVNAGILWICQSSGPAISTTQRFYSAQMFPSDDDTKASNTESVPPEWRPTPHIIVYASPFPC